MVLTWAVYYARPAQTLMGRYKLLGSQTLQDFINVFKCPSQSITIGQDMPSSSYFVIENTFYEEGSECQYLTLT